MEWSVTPSVRRARDVCNTPSKVGLGGAVKRPRGVYSTQESSEWVLSNAALDNVSSVVIEKHMFTDCGLLPEG